MERGRQVGVRERSAALRQMHRRQMEDGIVGQQRAQAGGFAGAQQLVLARLSQLAADITAKSLFQRGHASKVFTTEQAPAQWNSPARA